MSEPDWFARFARTSRLWDEIPVFKWSRFCLEWALIGAAYAWKEHGIGPPDWKRTTTTTSERR